MIVRVEAAVAAAFVLAACGGRPNLPSSPVPLGREFTLAVGESAAVSGSDLRVTFLGVESDSRCPIGVQCVWEGDAEVALAAASTGVPRAEYALHTSSRHAREAGHGTYRILLVRLEPDPRPEGPPARRDYRAALLVLRP